MARTKDTFCLLSRIQQSPGMRGLVKGNSKKRRRQRRSEGYCVESHVQVKWNKSATTKRLTNVRFEVENYKIFNLSDKSSRTDMLLGMSLHQSDVASSVHVVLKMNPLFRNLFEISIVRLFRCWTVLFIFVEI